MSGLTTIWTEDGDHTFFHFRHTAVDDQRSTPVDSSKKYNPCLPPSIGRGYLLTSIAPSCETVSGFIILLSRLPPIDIAESGSRDEIDG